MPASLIVPIFFEAGTFGAAALTLATHIVTTMVVTSLMTKDQPDQSMGAGGAGGKVQLPPYTDNALPVVYGDAWTMPIVVDAKISQDQQTMWYVLAFSEQTDSGTINFGEVYWDDKLLIFDPSNPNTILGWYDQGSNETVYGVAGKIQMWFYAGNSTSPTTHYCRNIDGTGGGYQATTVSAIEVLQDANIDAAQRWTSNHTMNYTVFAVCKIIYDQSTGLRGLGNIKAKIRNTLKQPGSVMRDYLGNDRYGCGVELANINTSSFNNLDTYSANSNTRVPPGDHPFSQPYYTLNGIIDVNQDCLSNLVSLADSADSWVQWNETLGQWSVLPNQSVEEKYGVGFDNNDLPIITQDNIIGGVQINPLDLNSSYNQLQVQFPNSIFWDAVTDQQVLDTFRGQPDYRYFEIPLANRAPNEPNNKLNLTLPFCNNSVQATFIGYKRLFASREDLVINFTMDYSGIQYDAGDIVCVKHPWFGWGAQNYAGVAFPGKPFRVTQIRELKQSDGTLAAQITAVSYNPDVYTTTDPHYFTTAGFSGISNPDLISKPGTPTFRLDLASTASTYVIQGDIPTTGNVLGMEFWYSQKGPDLTDNNYVLYTTQYYASTGTVTQTQLYPHTQEDGVTLFYEQARAVGLPTSSYWWRTRAVGPNQTSQFSDPSEELPWVLIVGGIVDGNQLLDNSIGGSKLVSGQSANPEQPSKSGNIWDQLGPVLGGSLAAAAAYGMYQKGWLDDLWPSDEPIRGLGNDEWEYPVNPYFTPRDSNGNPILTAEAGDTIEWVADVTPVQPDPFTYASNVGFEDYGFDSWDSGNWSDYG